MIPLHPAKPTGTYTTPIGFVMPPIPLADSGFSWLHSTWRPCSASNLHHLSSCCFPTSPSWAPASHNTLPESRVTNVQEAPGQKGLRSVGFAAVMNPFEFSPGLTARRTFRRCVVLDSLRDTREPSVQVCDILHTSCAISAVECSSASCAVLGLCHLHFVRGR